MLKQNRALLLMMMSCLLISVFELTLVMAAARHGIDLTDEGYALLWIKYPQIYKFTVTHFGIFYHFIFIFFGGSITAIRILNFVFTINLSIMLFWLIFRNLILEGNIFEKYFYFVLIFSLSLTSLAYTHFWLPTPNYNWLTLQGQLVCCIALVWSADEGSKSRCFKSGLLAGLGGWMVFLAKPPNAIATGALVALTWLLSYQRSFRLIASSVFVFLALFLLTAVMLSGSVSEFVLHLIDSNEISRRLRLNSSWLLIWRQDALIWQPLERNMFFAIAFGCFAVSWVVLQKAQLRAFAALFFLTLCLIGISEWVIMSGSYEKGLLQEIWIFAPPLGNAAAIGLHLLRLPRMGITRNAAFRALPALTLMPVTYAMASGNNLWLQSGSAGVFAVASTALLVSAVAPEDRRKSLLLWHALSSVAVTLVLTSIGTTHPYRQDQSLYYQAERYDSLPLVSKPMADYVGAIERAMEAAQPGKERILLDLTGLSPGLAIAVKARAPGEPWLLGGYPGSADFARASLYETSCADMASAFVMISPKGKRKLPDDTFGVFGIDISKDYKQIASLLSPFYHESVILLAPTSPFIVEGRCIKLKQINPPESWLAKLPPGGFLDQFLLRIRKNIGGGDIK
jgi:hypothetical protein